MAMPKKKPPVPTQWDTDAPISVAKSRQFLAAATGIPRGYTMHLRYLQGLFSKIANVKGDIVLFGVKDGGLLEMLATLVGLEGKGRRIIAVDDFQGWDPCEHDNSPRNPEPGEWGANHSKYHLTENTWHDRLTEAGVFTEFPDLKIEVVSEFPSDFKGQVALAYIDVDLYKAYKRALAAVHPHVVPGSIIPVDENEEYILESDDYRDEHGHLIEKWPGCTRAVADFATKHGLELEYDAVTKKFFFVIPTGQAA